MPYLRIQTNVPVADADRRPVMDRASRTVAEVVGKPEGYVMVALEDGVPMTFGGHDEPLVYLELKSIGLPESETATYAERLCAFAEEALGVGRERVYIEFANAARHMWGWNGGTF